MAAGDNENGSRTSHFCLQDVDQPSSLDRIGEERNLFRQGAVAAAENYLAETRFLVEGFSRGIADGLTDNLVCCLACQIAFHTWCFAVARINNLTHK